MGAAGGNGSDAAVAWEPAPELFFRPATIMDLDRVAELEARDR